MAARREDVLFLMLNPAYVRNFESVLSGIAGRGRRVAVLFEEPKPGGDRAGLELIDRLCGEHEGLSYEFEAAPRPSARRCLRLVLEALQDYLRYFEPPYGEGTRLRARSVARLPDALERALAAVLRRSPGTRRTLASVARRLDRRLGADPRFRSELERRRPGSIVVTPLVHFRARQREWIRAARELRIDSMLCVHSWDNLTNRGLMHALPDRIAVWNDAQRGEAVTLHGARPESIRITGAWPYDHWFSWRPSRSRREFCRQLGLAGDRATILYVCSSRFIAERERGAIAGWLRALRAAADPRVAAANVVVRPHPLNREEWRGSSSDDLPGATIFPAQASDPTDEGSRTDYFDSIAHADAVVGVNTSAMIESAILDRPALAFPAPTFRSSQQELPHFAQLVGERGFVEVSASMAEHVAQLGRALADPTAESGVRRRFVDAFIRPDGDAPPPTERVTSAIDDLAGGAAATRARAPDEAPTRGLTG